MQRLELVILRGPSQSGKSTVARALAARLGGRAAVIHIDDLAARWIVVHDTDQAAEEAMVYRQVRLLAAGYLKSGYHTVIEGAFASVDAGFAREHLDELRHLRDLMSTVPNARTTVVTLTAPLEELRRRAGAADGMDTSRVDALFRLYERSRLESVRIETAAVDVDIVVERILLSLGLLR